MAEDVFVVVKYDYEAQEPQELSIRKGQRLRLLDDSKNWWKVAEESTGRVGYIPSNYTRLESFVDRAKGTIKELTGQTPLAKSAATNKSHDAELSSAAAGRSLAMAESHGEATAKFSYEPTRDDELRLTKGDRITVLDKSSDGWWKGQVGNRQGWFPSNYVNEATSPPAPEPVADNGWNKPTPTAAAQTTSNNNNGTGGGGGQKVLEIVRCLYNFEASSSEELSFKKNEILDVVDHPAHDPDWWMARSTTGAVGLVPRNYISVIESGGDGGGGNGTGSGQPPPPQQQQLSTEVVSSQLGSLSLSGQYANKPWFWGSLLREDAERALQRAIEGDYLVRDSESQPGDLSISLKGRDRNKHFKVVADGKGGLRIGTRTFASMDDLIRHYTNNAIFSSDTEKLYLVRPLPRH